MSVLVRYQGRFGNLLFQYVCARLFADDNGLRFCTPPFDQELVQIETSSHGIEVDGPVTTITDLTPEILGKQWPPGRYVFDGYFQWSELYLRRREKIGSLVKPISQPEVNLEDIVINLRLGDDYRKLGWVIHPSWYLGILRGEKFRKLHIVCDFKDEAYLKHFEIYSPVVVCSGPKGDWNYLRSFDRLVCSNSTFCWWAAFFSRARKIYTFKRWIPYSGVNIGAFPEGEARDGLFDHEA